MGEGVWARDSGRGVVGVAAGRFSKASDVIEVETVSEDGSAVAEADDRLGGVGRFDSSTGYGEEKPAVGYCLRGGQGSWDACDHVDCGGNRGRWSESMGDCFLLCNLVMCL